QSRPHLVGEELAVVLPQIGTKLLLFGALFEEHRGAASRAFCGPCQVKAALRKTVTRSRLGGPGRSGAGAPGGRPPRSPPIRRGGRTIQAGDDPTRSASNPRNSPQPSRCER